MMADVQKGFVLEGGSSNSERDDEGFELRSYTLGGTEADDSEMRTMGRTQQLNVWIYSTNSAASSRYEVPLQLTFL